MGVFSDSDSDLLRHRSAFAVFPVALLARCFFLGMMCPIARGKNKKMKSDILNIYACIYSTQLIPLHQSDSSPKAIRTSTLFTILLHFSPFGARLLRVLRPFARKHGVPIVTILHLEFLLCELRKASTAGRAKAYPHAGPVSYPADRVVAPRW